MRSKAPIRALVLFFAFALAWAAMRGERYWPIVPFDMYSRAQLGDFRVFVLEGVDEDGKPFPVSGTYYMAPYSDASAQSLFMGGLQEGRDRLRLILRALKDQYQRRWDRAGRRGPRLAKLRLYVDTFAPDRSSWRSTVSPSKSTLFAEAP